MKDDRRRDKLSRSIAVFRLTSGRVLSGLFLVADQKQTVLCNNFLCHPLVRFVCFHFIPCLSAEYSFLSRLSLSICFFDCKLNFHWFLFFLISLNALAEKQTSDRCFAVVAQMNFFYSNIIIAVCPGRDFFDTKLTRVLMFEQFICPGKHLFWNWNANIFCRWITMPKTKRLLYFLKKTNFCTRTSSLMIHHMNTHLKVNMGNLITTQTINRN